MIRLRLFRAAVALCAMLLAVCVGAQQATRSPPIVGVLSPLEPGEAGVQTFRDRLRDLGYRENSLTARLPRA